MISNAISRMEAMLDSVPQRFRLLDQDAAVQPLSEGKWSRLQLLGHLCDSSINNLCRIVQIDGHTEAIPVIVPYDQENWVKAQRYIDAPPEEVLALWVSLNQSVLRVITGLSPASLARTAQFPSGTTVTLEWLIDDYVAHMEHHLQQIVGH